MLCLSNETKKYMKHTYLVFAFFLLGTMACGSGEKKSVDDEAVQTVLPDEKNVVTVINLLPSQFDHELLSNGKLSARRQVELKFQSAETIAAVYVKNGDRVQKGQKLGELDKFRLHRRTEAARDALSRARLELQDVLIGQGYALADSAKVPVAIMQLARVKSGYDKARIDYDLTLFEEQHAVLTAPFDGIVANLFTRALNTASPQEVFCTVIDNQSLEADFTVLESELALIKLGDRVRVSPFSAPDAEVEGRISEINPLVNADGMVKVKAAVSGGGKLFEGMNVRVRIQRLLGKKLVVPKEAVVLRSGKQVVFTLEKGKAMWNYVTTGLENVDSYTVEDGLKEGDVVIVSGNINLAHEAPVSVL